MRSIVLASLLCLGCKDKDTGATVDDADADTDVDVDADTDVDVDTDADADPPPPECWVPDPSGIGVCFDRTVDGCAFPTSPLDSDSDGSPDSFVFLNQCPPAGVQGVPFDNASRIPASTWVPGDPLPPVP